MFIKVSFKRVGVWLLALLWLLPGISSAAKPVDVAVVLSKSSQPYEEFYRQLEAGLADKPRSFRLHRLNGEISGALAALAGRGIRPRLIVAAGSQAADRVLALKTPLPTLFSLIPSIRYRHRIASADWCRRAGNCSAVYLDQPVQRQLAVIRRVLPEVRRLGVLLGPASIALRDELQQAAAKQDLQLTIIEAGARDNLVALTNRLSRDSDALLALPDPAIYNRKTAKGILLATYRYRIPLLAYSHGFVRAGALFSLYSAPAQIGRQSAGVLVASVTRGDSITLPAPHYPESFRFEINPAVRHALRARIRFDDKAIEELLRQSHE